MKKVLFNCTTNVVGGGAKNSYLLIRHILSTTSSWIWYFAVSNEVLALLKSNCNRLPENIYVFEHTPATSLRSRSELLKLVSGHKIDLVYTMAGPAYVRFDCYHIQGISNPYITHVDYRILKMKLTEYCATRLRVSYQSLWAQRADHFIFQTDYSRNQWLLKTGKMREMTSVVPNSYDPEFIGAIKRSREARSIINVNYVFIPGSAFAHKNHFLILDLIARYEEELRALGIVFITTLSKDSSIANHLKLKLERLDCIDLWENIGNISYSKIASIYVQSRVVLITSLLETFSATYLEAMIAQKPLIVMDVPYAREICSDHAIYVEVDDNLKLINELGRVIAGDTIDFKNGLSFVEDNFISSQERNEKILELLEVLL